MLCNFYVHQGLKENPEPPKYIHIFLLLPNWNTSLETVDKGIISTLKVG